jgi:hypothetical protein
MKIKRFKESLRSNRLRNFSKNLLGFSRIFGNEDEWYLSEFGSI